MFSTVRSMIMKHKNTKAKPKETPEKVSIWSVIRPVLQIAVLLAFVWLAKLCTGSIPFLAWIAMCVVMILQLPKWAQWVFGISGFCVVYAITELFYHSAKAILGGYWVLLMLAYGLILALTRLIVALIRYIRALS